jgi:thiol-disulfide isomerase/thioredoxin
MRRIAAVLLVFGAWAGCVSAAPALAEAAAVPHLAESGRDDYGQFLASPPHRAFAIAPGGAWAWSSGKADGDEAAAAALASCRSQQPQSCVLYAVDDRVVFDPRAWTRLWGPYASAAEAGRKPVGMRRGERFPNLAFFDAAGRRQAVADLRGKVTVLHFWGSWCGPCRREMPELEKLRDSLRANDDIGFTLLQVREKFATAAQWAAAQKINLPLFDSGSTGESDALLQLAGGGRVGDREIAKVFPTTYVLDRHGIVVFSHVGPVRDWSQYREFLIDAARRSGR